jgi:probable HAF family extracellular repeat protein
MIDHRVTLLLMAGVLIGGCGDAAEPTPSRESTEPLAKRSTSTGITVTDLGLGTAEDINDDGKIVGSRGSSSGPLHAFLWTPNSSRSSTGSFTDLGNLGGGMAQGRGINSQAQVVGSSTIAAGQQTAFLWEAGTMHNLGIPAGTDIAEAMDVNDASIRLAVGGVASPIDRAFVWTVSGTGSSFQVTSFDVLTGLTTSGSFAFAVNDDAVVVGYSNVLTGYSNQPVFWTNSGTAWNPASRLALLPGALGGVARDINSAGQIVGQNVMSTSGCGTRAVVWSTGSAAAAPLPGLSATACSEAFATNDHGQIAGYSSDRRGFHAVLWQPSTSGYTITDLGQIRGTGSPIVYGMNEPLADGSRLELVGLTQSRERATLWTLP